MIKAIIFDYYGVLTTDRYLTWLLRNPRVMRDHPAEIKALSQEQDLGLGADEFFVRLAAIAGEAVEEVRSEFNIREELHYGLVDYIRRLRSQGFKTAILSNAPRSLYDQTARHNLTDLFELILCSEEAGVTKPHPKIYQMALERLDVDAKDAVFVDDREYNVEGAKAVGMEGVHYTDLATLETEFARRGLDTAR